MALKQNRGGRMTAFKSKGSTRLRGAVAQKWAKRITDGKAKKPKKPR